MAAGGGGSFPDALVPSCHLIERIVCAWSLLTAGILLIFKA